MQFSRLDHIAPSIFEISEASFKSRLAQLLEEDVAADVITFSAAISACQAHGLGNTIVERRV